MSIKSFEMKPKKELLKQRFTLYIVYNINVSKRKLDLT